MKILATNQPKTFRTWRTRNRHIILLSAIILGQFTTATGLLFTDVTKKYGLPLQRRLKYGGACVTDLDSDGRPDIIQFHHTDCCTTIHFNNGPNEKFTKAKLKFKGDIHALVPFQPSTHFDTMPYVSISIGGRNGNRPSRPNLLKFNTKREIQYITQFSKDNVFPLSVAGRGRTILYTKVRRSKKNKLGAILLNAPGSGKNRLLALKNINKIVEWKKNRFRQPKVNIGLIGNDKNGYGALTDIDNDGTMEVLLFEELRMYNLTKDLSFEDISEKINLPKENFVRSDTYFPGIRGVSAACEIDFNNDGFWDVYVTRSSQGDLRWLRMSSNDLDDVLLLNERGKKYKVKFMSKILRSSNRGVTSGDFNNDGYVDLYISSQNTKYDYLMLNQFGKYFKVRKITRKYKGPGDAATAFDFNGDGYLDILVSTGDWIDQRQRGYFYLLQNSGFHVYKNYLIVRVLNSPEGRVTNLHAVVSVKLKGRKGMMMRRVGGSNGASTGVALLRNLHFGMGKIKVAEWILVKWSNGEKAWYVNVGAQRTIVAGR